MTTQPEALRLAERLGRYDVERSGYAKHCHAAAAELRRLHEVNAELLDALHWLLSGDDGEDSFHKRLQAQLTAIAKAEGEAK
jgi:hypothetical protein